MIVQDWPCDLALSKVMGRCVCLVLPWKAVLPWSQGSCDLFPRSGHFPLVPSTAVGAVLLPAWDEVRLEGADLERTGRTWVLANVLELLYQSAPKSLPFQWTSFCVRQWTLYWCLRQCEPAWKQTRGETQSVSRPRELLVIKNAFPDPRLGCHWFRAKW